MSIQKKISDVAEAIKAWPPSRELSLAVTKLEEASMWAEKGGIKK